MTSQPDRDAQVAELGEFAVIRAITSDLPSAPMYWSGLVTTARSCPSTLR
jgi:hypothetical protein